MKRLIIMRHAKAEPYGWNKDDFRRDLVDRGLTDAAGMARFLQQKEVKPQTLWVSLAHRATQTAEVVMNTFGSALADHTHQESDLYLADVQTTVSFLAQSQDGHDTVMFIGHNPGASYLVHWLTKEAVDLKTAGVADVSIDIDRWADIKTAEGQAQLVHHWKPKDVGVNG